MVKKKIKFWDYSEYGDEYYRVINITKVRKKYVVTDAWWDKVNGPSKLTIDSKKEATTLTKAKKIAAKMKRDAREDIESWH